MRDTKREKELHREKERETQRERRRDTKRKKERHTERMRWNTSTCPKKTFQKLQFHFLSSVELWFKLAPLEPFLSFSSILVLQIQTFINRRKNKIHERRKKFSGANRISSFIRRCKSFRLVHLSSRYGNRKLRRDSYSEVQRKWNDVKNPQYIGVFLFLQGELTIARQQTKKFNLNLETLTFWMEACEKKKKKPDSRWEKSWTWGRFLGGCASHRRHRAPPWAHCVAWMADGSSFCSHWCLDSWRRTHTKISTWNKMMKSSEFALCRFQMTILAFLCQLDS